jgi:hypothetical protein
MREEARQPSWNTFLSRNHPAESSDPRMKAYIEGAFG